MNIFAHVFCWTYVLFLHKYVRMELLGHKRYVCACSAVFQSGCTKLHPSPHLSPTHPFQNMPAHQCKLCSFSSLPFLHLYSFNDAFENYVSAKFTAQKSLSQGLLLGRLRQIANSYSFIYFCLFSRCWCDFSWWVGPYKQGFNP